MDVQNGIDSPALASMANGAIQLIDKARAALAARQPVGKIDEAAVLRRAAAVLDMWEGDSNQTGYMGDFKDAQAILEVLAQNAAQSAQAVDPGEVREAVRKAWQKCAAGESVDLQFGTLLALIDSTR